MVLKTIRVIYNAVQHARFKQWQLTSKMGEDSKLMDWAFRMDCKFSKPLSILSRWSLSSDLGQKITCHEVHTQTKLTELNNAYPINNSETQPKQINEFRVIT